MHVTSDWDWRWRDWECSGLTPEQKLLLLQNPEGLESIDWLISLDSYWARASIQSASETQDRARAPGGPLVPARAASVSLQFWSSPPGGARTPTLRLVGL